MKKAILTTLIAVFLSGCTTWNAGRIEPKGEPNRMGFTSKTKVSESVAISEEVNAALSVLPPSAFAVHSCNPELTEAAEMACVIGNAMAMQAAYLMGMPTTGAGEVAYAGRDAVKAVVSGLTQRSKARWRAATFGLSGFFAKETAKVIGESNAAIASTVAQNGGIRIGSIQQSSSRHNGSAGEGGAGGEGAGGAGTGGGIDGDSLNQLVIGNNNASGLGTDNARLTGATNHSVSTLAEPSSNVSNIQDVGKTQGTTTADELEAPVSVQDDDGGQSLF